MHFKVWEWSDRVPWRSRKIFCNLLVATLPGWIFWWSGPCAASHTNLCVVLLQSSVPVFPQSYTSCVFRTSSYPVFPYPCVPSSPSSTCLSRWAWWAYLRWGSSWCGGRVGCLLWSWACSWFQGGRGSICGRSWYQSPVFRSTCRWQSCRDALRRLNCWGWGSQWWWSWWRCHRSSAWARPRRGPTLQSCGRRKWEIVCGRCPYLRGGRSTGDWLIEDEIGTFLVNRVVRQVHKLIVQVLRPRSSVLFSGKSG